MDNKQYIHSLFENKNYLEIYSMQPSIINNILFIDNQNDFKDFISCENFLNEYVFWLYYAALNGDNIIINGYEECATPKITKFLKEKLPENIFLKIEHIIQNIYVNIDDENNPLEEKINLCNECLLNTDYLIKIDFDDTYCAGVYFLYVTYKI